MQVHGDHDHDGDPDGNDDDDDKELGIIINCDDDNLTTRIPNFSLYTSVHVTKNAHGDISGTKRGIIDLLV